MSFFLYRKYLLDDKARRVCILGSTGSIGCNSLKVIDNLNKNGYNTYAAYLTTNSNIDELASQVNAFKPKGVVIQDESSCKNFLSKYNFSNLEVLPGRNGLKEIASRNDYDVLINALVGFSGFELTALAIQEGKVIALANKETLVAGGQLISDLLKKFNTKLIPIDSEHSAILQCLIGESENEISRIILTASGGPFLNKSLEEIRNTTVENALAHPNWKMGNKITIDSSTMMNKGLEVIETKWLFDIDPEKIEVVIHPQSIIHSMVEFSDGSVKAQLGVPDMKIPIQYSLTYPARVKSDYPKIDFTQNISLTFEEPDLEKFSCLKIAYSVLRSGGTYAAVMNTANEVAVDLFLKNKIKFYQIPEIIESSLEKHENLRDFSFQDLISIDNAVRRKVLEQWNN